MGGLEASGVVIPDKSIDSDTSFDAVTLPSGLPIAINQKILDPMRCAELCIPIAIGFGGLGFRRKAKQWLQASIWREHILAFPMLFTDVNS